MKPYFQNLYKEELKLTFCGKGGGGKLRIILYARLGPASFSFGQGVYH